MNQFFEALKRLSGQPMEEQNLLGKGMSEVKQKLVKPTPNKQQGTSQKR